MRFRKIPRRWLIHSVQIVEKTTNLGAFGRSNVSEGQVIDKVRVIDPKTELSVTANNEQRSVNAILLHQPGVSTDCTFEVGKHLKFNGRLYEIVEVNPIYELTKLHHTEVKLSYVTAKTDS